MSIKSFQSSIWLLILGLGATFCFQRCYTLKGFSIDPSVTTYFVDNFTNESGNAPPTIGIDFTERLKDKIRSETRLRLLAEQPDITFSGRIVEYSIIPIAPKPGELVSLNQLVITIKVNYTDNKNEKNSWQLEERWSQNAEFSSDTDLLSVQDRLIKEISDRLLEDIFNKAFNNW